LKACGVTFVLSMLERVIEERAKGDPRGERHPRRHQRESRWRPGAREARLGRAEKLNRR
jgi:fumarylacetoacetate (FAA) hydrolase family protein